MNVVADLHLHSPFSRAVSKYMTLEGIYTTAKKKGITLLSAPDWTHPVWLPRLVRDLEETGEGVYSLKGTAGDIRFVLSTEIACIYKQGEKLRRIHVLVLAPNLSIAEKITHELLNRGCNLSADGRPIVGLSAQALLELILTIDEHCLMIPAHVWTPHFGVFGSASGFDSLVECFGELAEHIYAIETGLSSDPEMNWAVKELATRSIVSFSDAHSPAKMGRELTLFELEHLGFSALRQALMQPSLGSHASADNRVVSTVEFYPEEGKYYYSGHRNCQVRFGLEEIRNRGNLCPVCGRRLTEGVLYRIEEVSKHASYPAERTLSDTKVQVFTDPERLHPPFFRLVPLLEIVAESVGTRVGSKKAQDLYERVCSLGSELDILLHLPLTQIASVGGEKLAQAVQKVRLGDIVIKPGFDGEYGTVTIWEHPLSSDELEIGL